MNPLLGRTPVLLLAGGGGVLEEASVVGGRLGAPQV